MPCSATIVNQHRLPQDGAYTSVLLTK